MFVRVIRGRYCSEFPGMGPSCALIATGQVLLKGNLCQVVRNLVHHAQSCITPAADKALPAQLPEHLSDTTGIVPAVADISSRSPLDHLQSIDVSLGVRVPYRGCVFQVGSDKSLICVGFDSFRSNPQVPADQTENAIGFTCDSFHMGVPF